MIHPWSLTPHPLLAVKMYANPFMPRGKAFFDVEDESMPFPSMVSIFFDIDDEKEWAAAIRAGRVTMNPEDIERVFRAIN